MKKLSDLFSSYIQKYRYQTRYTYNKIITSYKVSKTWPEFFKNINSYYDKLYIAHKKRILEYNSDNLSLVILKDSLGWQDRKGKFFKKETLNNKIEIKEVKYYEALEANIICLGGIDFDNYKTHSSLIECVEGLLKDKDLINCNIFSYQSVLGKNERYADLIRYSFNDSYISTPIMDFTKKFLCPIIRRRDEYIEDKAFFTLVGFSAGAREIMMIENALNVLLKQAGFNDEQIKNVLKRINVISLGYASKLDQKNTNNNAGKFGKIIIYSIEDAGVLAPESLSQTTLDHEKVNYAEPYAYIMNKDADVLEARIILPKGALKKQMPGKRVNSLGHSLPYYIDAINTKFPQPALEAIRETLLKSVPKVNNVNWQKKILEQRLHNEKDIELK